MRGPSLPALVMAFAVAFATLIVPSVSHAHGMNYAVLDAGKVVAIRAGFSNGEPAAYGEVLVFAPGDDKTEFQNGRTDAKGRFAFLPDRPGQWKIRVDGGLGHRVEFTVDVKKADQPVAAARTSDNGMVLPALLGLSLFLNLILFARGRKQKPR